MKTNVGVYLKIYIICSDFGSGLSIKNFIGPDNIKNVYYNIIKKAVQI